MSEKDRRSTRSPRWSNEPSSFFHYAREAYYGGPGSDMQRGDEARSSRSGASAGPSGLSGGPPASGRRGGTSGLRRATGDWPSTAGSVDGSLGWIKATGVWSTRPGFGMEGHGPPPSFHPLGPTGPAALAHLPAPAFRHPSERDSPSFRPAARGPHSPSSATPDDFSQGRHPFSQKELQQKAWLLEAQLAEVFTLQVHGVPEEREWATETLFRLGLTGGLPHPHPYEAGTKYMRGPLLPLESRMAPRDGVGGAAFGYASSPPGRQRSPTFRLGPTSPGAVAAGALLRDAGGAPASSVSLHSQDVSQGQEGGTTNRISTVQRDDSTSSSNGAAPDLGRKRRHRDAGLQHRDTEPTRSAQLPAERGHRPSAAESRDKKLKAGRPAGDQAASTRGRDEGRGQLEPGREKFAQLVPPYAYPGYYTGTLPRGPHGYYEDAPSELYHLYHGPHMPPFAAPLVAREGGTDLSTEVQRGSFSGQIPIGRWPSPVSGGNRGPGSSKLEERVAMGRSRGILSPRSESPHQAFGSRCFPARF